MGYVRRIADRYRGLGVPAEDLHGEAYLGLCIAADRFDGVKYPEVPFEAYAGWWARKYVLAAIAAGQSSGMGGVPHRLARAANQCRAARERLMAAGNPSPSVEEIAAQAGLRPAIVRQAMDLPSMATQAQAVGILATQSDRRQDRAADEIWDALALCTKPEIAVVLKLWGLDGGNPLTVAQTAKALDLTSREVLSMAENARQTMGDDLRSRGWTPERWTQSFGQSA